MAEWLGRALQKLVQRFESASDLNTKTPVTGFFVFQTEAHACMQLRDGKQKTIREADGFGG
jgi:hypothetical protein